MRERPSAVSDLHRNKFGDEGVFTPLHIGLDDIDATIGGCTTHLAHGLVKKILKEFREASFIDYPNLVRLNPSIPFKTRGNGAVAIRLLVEVDVLGELIAAVTDIVRDYLRSLKFRPTTDPGLIFLKGDPDEGFKKFYFKALTDYVPLDLAEAFIRRRSDVLEAPLGVRRGLVGAIAAVGWPEGVDCTYELLAYRVKRACGPRCIDDSSVKEMDKLMRSETFLNYDYLEGKELISPHGPDPVLLGIRGESPEAVLTAYRLVRVCEPVAGYMIFRTNQATDSHHVRREAGRFHPFQTGCVEGVVTHLPETLEGGAVIVKLRGSSSEVRAVTYRESGLNGITQMLREGDEVMVCGVMRYWDDLGPVLNVEKLVLRRVVRYVLMNPRCPKCGARMKSAGKGKGWKCPKCGYRDMGLVKEAVPLSRSLREALYLPRESAFRHLMKPLSRYGREKVCRRVEPGGVWVK